MITAKIVSWTICLNNLGDKALPDIELFRRRMIGGRKIEYPYFAFNKNVSKIETEWAHGTFFSNNK